MDKDLENKLAGNKDADPIVRLLLSAVYSETRHIEDSIEGLGERLAEKFTEDFVPRHLVNAIPAIMLVEPSFREGRSGDGADIDGSCLFSYKSKDVRQALNYIPLLHSHVAPISPVYYLSISRLTKSSGTSGPEHTREGSNVLWVGLKVPPELDSMHRMTLLLRKGDAVLPRRIYVGETGHELGFATMRGMEEVDMAEPFGISQASGRFFSFVHTWQEWLLECGGLLYFTDDTKDRDLFKAKKYPSAFQYLLTSQDMDAIPDNLLWLKIVFPEGYEVPEDCVVQFNCFPVVNVDIGQVMLTQASPIAKLQKTDDSFFLDVLQTSSTESASGFDGERDEYIIRDFDTRCYDEGELFRDVRTLYWHFVEDYYAFLDFNGVKDGELIRKLRESVNKIGKGFGGQHARYNYGSGVYAMKNLESSGRNSSTRVAYMTTLGRLGNTPKAGEILENRKCPGIERDVRIVTSASCGKDKAGVDERYEILRYHTMTGDRLYTKMDIDAYVRKEVMAFFGSKEFPRVSVEISVEGTGGVRGLERGLYVDLLFKDAKNYEMALSTSFQVKLEQGIANRSCLSMPVKVCLVNLDV